MPSNPNLSGSRVPTVFLALSQLLMAATIVFSNVLCDGECSLLSLKFWYWAGPIKLSGVLVAAAALLMFRHPMAYLAAILIGSCAVYDVSLGVYEAWRSYSAISLELAFTEGLFPIWRGLIRGGLGILFVIYGSMRLFRKASGGRLACAERRDSMLLK